MLTGAATRDQLAVPPGQGRRRHRRAHGHLQGADRGRRRGASERRRARARRRFHRPSTRTASTTSPTRCAARDWAEIEARSGLTRGALEAAATVYAHAERVIGIYGMGLTQHRKGVENVQMLVNLLLLRGNIGKPGAGICPVRGHSNVQGQRTVGITEKPELVPLDKLEEQFGFEPPREKGLQHGRGLRGHPRRQGARRSSASAAISSARSPSAAAWSRPGASCASPCRSRPSSTAAIWSTARSPTSCPASAASRSTSRRAARRR